jgi:hypothetical protein
MADLADHIRVGAIWREVSTGRTIRILEEEVHGTGPAWTYCDAAGKEEPDGPDHPTWFWHYCDIYDFVVWKRFVPVTETHPDA